MPGIDQSLEVVDALRMLAEQFKLIMADGKIGIADLRHLGPAFEALKKAKEGAEIIPEELKDLDGEEIGELLMGMAEVAMLAYDALVSSPK